MDPTARDAIEKDIGLARGVDGLNPLLRKRRETFCLEDTVERIPSNRVKRLSKVEFEHDGRDRALVAGLDKVYRIDKNFSN